MEEQLAACENHLQEKADKLEALQKEVPFTVSTISQLLAVDYGM